MIFLPNWKVNCAQGSSQRKPGKRRHSSRAVIVAPIGERSEQQQVLHKSHTLFSHFGSTWVYHICCVSCTPDQREFYFLCVWLVELCEGHRI